MASVVAVASVAFASVVVVVPAYTVLVSHQNGSFVSVVVVD